MRELARELRLAARGLLRARAFSVTVVVTLAVGLGLNAAIFTVVDCVLLKPLPFAHADRLVAVRTHFIDESRSIPRLGGGDYNDLASQVKGLESVAYYGSWDAGLQMGGRSYYLPVAWVSPGFANVLGVKAVAGRLFRAGEHDGTDVLVSAAFARERFGREQASLGAPVNFMGRAYTVAGVLPDGFAFPAHAELWFERPAESQESRTSYSAYVIGLRRADVSAAQLDGELQVFSGRLQQGFAEDKHKSLEAVPLQDQLVGSVRPTLRLLMGAAAVLLLVVCANLAHLLLVRAMRGLRAVSVRTALGATRGALARHAIVEICLLAGVGAVGAALVAMPALRLLTRVAPADMPRLADVRLNADVFLFSLAVSAVVMVAATLVPVWRSWHADPATALRADTARGGEARHAARLREGLLVGEVALTLALCVVAVLLARQLLAESRTELGFEPDALVTLDAHAVLTRPVPEARDQSSAEKARVEQAWSAIGLENTRRLQGALASVRAVPGVAQAAAMDGAPMSGGGTDLSYAVRGRQVFAPGVEHLPEADARLVDPELFETLGMPLLRGRGVNENDRDGTPEVVVINQALAREQFAGRDPVGQELDCGLDKLPNRLMVVGVAGDIRADSPGAPPVPTMYLPVAQHGLRSMDIQIVARVHGDAGAMAETLRRALEQARPDMAVKASVMREDIRGSERGERFRSWLLASFAGVSILLAAVGTYGVTAYTVEQRRFEFGLRMALGADRAEVLRMVLGKALRLALMGVVAGLMFAVALAHVMAGMSFVAVTGWDVPAYGYAALGVLTMVLAAAAWPARRAAGSEPMVVLRAE